MNTPHTLSLHGSIAERRQIHYGHMRPMSLSCGSRTAAHVQSAPVRLLYLLTGQQGVHLAALSGSRPCYVRDTPGRPTLWPRPAIDVQTLLGFPGRFWAITISELLVFSGAASCKPAHIATALDHMQAPMSSLTSSAARGDRKTASRRRGSGGSSSLTRGCRTGARPPCVRKLSLRRAASRVIKHGRRRRRLRRRACAAGTTRTRRRRSRVEVEA